jgi:hypothetical protein
MDAATEVLLLKDQRKLAAEHLKRIDDRIADLEANGQPETGSGTPDEGRVMKERETATAEPKAERAMKPKATKRTRE